VIAMPVDSDCLRAHAKQTSQIQKGTSKNRIGGSTDSPRTPKMPIKSKKSVRTEPCRSAKHEFLEVPKRIWIWVVFLIVFLITSHADINNHKFSLEAGAGTSYAY
jgi:hypothetical protein